MKGGQKRSRKSWKTILGYQGALSENWHSDSLKKNHFTLSQGKKKKGDEVDVGVHCKPSPDDNSCLN
jgi:hypothetical protein